MNTRWSALLLVLLVSPLVAEARQSREERQRALREGTHVLRRILFDRGYTALERYADLAEAPDRTLLLVLGDLDELANVPNGLESFVRRGGAVLIAGDRPPGRPEARRQLLTLAGVSVGTDRVICPQATRCYRGREFCPMVEAIAGADPPVFRATEQQPIATNVPSYLLERFLPPDIRRLARLPTGAVLEVAGLGLVDVGQPLFAVGGEVGQGGKVLVLADHSVFINEMMLPTDTGNVEFTYRLLEWFGQTPRDRVLLVENGAIQTRLDIPLQRVNLPIEEMLGMLFDKRNELLAELSDGLTRLEDRNAFNNTLLEVLSQAGISPGRLNQWLIGLLTAIGVILVIYRLGVRGRFRHEDSVPVLSGIGSKMAPGSSLLEQRGQALLRLGNLSEPASLLVRRWFAEQGVPFDPHSRPRFVVTGNWWVRWSLPIRLQRLWRIATGQSTHRFSKHQLRDLVIELNQLAASRQRGVWRSADRPALARQT